MTTARDDILGAIRRSLRATEREAPRRAVMESRLVQAPKGVVPARGRLDAPGRLALFQRMAEAVQATVAVVDALDDVPAEAARYLRDANLPATLRRGADPRLAAMPWDGTTLEVSAGRSDGGQLNAISHAFAGIAESGTLALLSGKDNPTTLNFLPDNHIVVLDAADLVGDMETVFARLRERFGKGVMPRTLNFVTGPSRSADIGQTMLLGAHGPRNLHIVVVRNEGAGLPLS